MITAKVDGAKLVARALALIEPDVNAEISGLIRSAAEEALARARANVPRNTGELASTLRVRVGRTGLVAWVQAGYGSLLRRKKGTGKRKSRRAANATSTATNTGLGVYAMVVEFGDARRSRRPQPYLFPAVESVRASLRQRVDAALTRATARASARASDGTDS